MSLPAGTVTFVFSDIAGSTRLQHELGDDYGDVVSAHRRLLRDAFQQAGGSEVDTQGDAFFFAFPSARSAVSGAIAGQRALAEHAWPGGVKVQVRMGLHTGEPSIGEEGYLGLDVVRAARISSAAHGGQILVSQTTRTLIGNLPDGVVERDLGEHGLKDFDRPERLYQLSVAGLPDSFPPPKTATPETFDTRVERFSATLQDRILEQIESSLAAGEAPKGTTKLALGRLLTLFALVAAIVAVVLLIKVAF
jgi:class 3 adenylate cyclase